MVDNLLTFLLAGHETTALALTWTFYLLSLRPEIAERVVQEIETVTQGGSLREEHVEALSYTRQVVQEAMRLYPPAPVVVRAAICDVHLGNELIRAGSPTYIPVYAIHRHGCFGTSRTPLIRIASPLRRSKRDTATPICPLEQARGSASE